MAEPKVDGMVNSDKDAAAGGGKAEHPANEAALLDFLPSAGLAPAGLREDAFLAASPESATLAAAGTPHHNLQRPDADGQRATSSLSKSSAIGQSDDEAIAAIVGEADRVLDPSAPPDFSEEDYLALNPDVAGAIGPDGFSSGLEHYKHHGRGECRPYLTSLDGFDEESYLDMYPEIREAVQQKRAGSGLGHYLAYGRSEGRHLAPNLRTQRLMVDRLTRFGPADPKRYVLHNPGVAVSTPENAEADALRHYVIAGWREMRRIQSTARLAKSVGRVVARPVVDAPAPQPSEFDLAGRRFVVCANSGGNYFMHSIAEEVVQSLRECGAGAELSDENDRYDAARGTYVFVAPHEFFGTGKGKAWIRDDIVTNAVTLNTEQIQTTWYEQSLPFLMMSRAVVDMYYHSTVLLGECGAPAHHWVPDPDVSPLPLQPGDEAHPLLRASGLCDPAASRELDFWSRPIDVSFFGTESPKRDIVLAQLGGTLAELRSFIYYRRFSMGPLNAENGGESLVRVASNVAAGSKISLNLHRDEYGAFEWYRMVRLGMCAGSVVVTDECLDVPTFKAGEHYLMSDARHLPDLLHWALNEADGRAAVDRIRANAHGLLTRRLEETPSAKSLAAFLKRVTD